MYDLRTISSLHKTDWSVAILAVSGPNVDEIILLISNRLADCIPDVNVEEGLHRVP